MNNNEIINNYYDIYNNYKNEIILRLEGFSRVPREEYFYELAYCLCTPMSKAENAWQVQQKFQEVNFLHSPFNPVNILSNPKHYIRFHNQKSKYILENLSQFDEILKIIDLEVNNIEKRNVLAKAVKGFNLKEASHFLRNIGFRGLAILDRHILRNMKELELINRDFIIKNWNDYFKVEAIFKQFSEEIHIESDILDLVLLARETGKVLK